MPFENVTKEQYEKLLEHVHEFDPKANIIKIVVEQNPKSFTAFTDSEEFESIKIS